MSWAGLRGPVGQRGIPFNDCILVCKKCGSQGKTARFDGREWVTICTDCRCPDITAVEKPPRGMLRVWAEEAL
jgi:hypothetical protein